MAATELSYGKLKKWLLGKGCGKGEVENCPDKAHLLILMQKKGIEVTLKLPISAVLLKVVSLYLFFCSEFPLSCLSLVQDDAPAASGPDTPDSSAKVSVEPNIDRIQGAPELPKLVKRRPVCAFPSPLCLLLVDRCSFTSILSQENQTSSHERANRVVPAQVILLCRDPYIDSCCASCSLRIGICSCKHAWRGAKRKLELRLEAPVPGGRERRRRKHVQLLRQIVPVLLRLNELPQLKESARMQSLQRPREGRALPMQKQKQHCLPAVLQRLRLLVFPRQRV